MLRAKRASEEARLRQTECAILGLDDFRGDEENQFIGFRLNQALLEEIAEPRNVAQDQGVCEVLTELVV